MTWASTVAVVVPSPAWFPLRGSAFDDAQNVGLLHDHEFFPIDLDLAARPFAEQDAVAGLDVERVDLAVLAPGTGARSDDLALHRLLLCGIGNDDPAGGLLILLDAANQDTVMQGPKLH
jgi:hypothetical protein